MQKAFDRPLFTLTLVAAGLLCFGSVKAEEKSPNVTAGKPMVVRSAVAVPAERRFDLRAYGARFQRAIDATEADARKPDWTWDNQGRKARIAKTR